MVLGPGTSGHSIKAQGSRNMANGPDDHKCDIYATLYR
jgi:hypothetical protein